MELEQEISIMPHRDLRRLLQESVNRLNEVSESRKRAGDVGGNSTMIQKDNEEYEVIDLADEDDHDDEDSEAGSVSDEECDGEGIFINPFHSSDPEGSEVEDEDETSINDLVKALVFNYLKVTAPTLSKEFEYANSFHGTQLQLEEVITSLRKSKEILTNMENDGQDELSQGTLHRNGKDGSTEDLVKGLVFNFLRDTTPSLAKDFEEAFSFSHTQLQLEEVLDSRFSKHQTKTNVKTQDQRTEDKKMCARKNRPTGFNIRRFTHAEDEVIREVIANTESGGSIDHNALAKRLNRGFRSIQNRIESLKLNGGIHRYKNYSLSEDFTILETLILPRLLKQEKLSKIVLSNCHYEQLAKELNRRLHSVRNRWQGSIQPCLLKYYAGTLNLQVERMLAEYIANTYTDFSEINWPVVAARPDFAGHTEISLKNTYFQILMKSTKKTLGRKNHVTVAEIAEHSRTYKPAWKINKDKWQQPLIAHFQQRIDQLGIKDFL